MSTADESLPRVASAGDVPALAEATGDIRQKTTDQIRCDRCGLFFAPADITADKVSLFNLCATCQTTFAALAALPIIDAQAPAIRLTDIFVIVAVDRNGDEGIMGLTIGASGLALPLVVGDEAQLPALVKVARTKSDNEGMKYRVYHFSQGVDITDRSSSDNAESAKS